MFELFLLRGRGSKKPIRL